VIFTRNINTALFLERTRHSTEQKNITEARESLSLDLFFFKLFFRITDIQCSISNSNSKMFPQEYFYEAEG